MVTSNGQIESWVWDVVDRLRAGQPIEDTRVELKRNWIDPPKAARRLAGHANAARGDQILWIVGLDEKEADPVVGVAEAGFLDWWSKVRSYFDELAPDVRDLNVPVDGRALVAILVDTSRMPYAVRNPDYGTTKTAIAREVPWREGTQVRSARRNELLRMILPQVAQPTVDVLGYNLEYRGRPNSSGAYTLLINLYLRVPALDAPLVYPDHDTLVDGGVGDNPILFREAQLLGPHRGGTSTLLETAHRGSWQLVVEGSGPVRVLARSNDVDHNAEPDPPDPSEAAWANVIARAVGADRPLVEKVRMPFLGEETNVKQIVRRWGVRVR